MFPQSHKCTNTSLNRNNKTPILVRCNMSWIKLWHFAAPNTISSIHGQRWGKSYRYYDMRMNAFTFFRVITLRKCLLKFVFLITWRKIQNTLFVVRPLEVVTTIFYTFRNVKCPYKSRGSGGSGTVLISWPKGFEFDPSLRQLLDERSSAFSLTQTKLYNL